MFGTNTPFQVPALQSPVEPMTHQSSGHTSEDPDSYDLLPLCYKPLKLCNLFLIPENHVSKEPMKIMTFNAQKKIIYEVYFKESHDITSEYILIYIPAKTCFNTSVTSPNEPPRVVHPMFIPTNHSEPALRSEAPIAPPRSCNPKSPQASRSSTLGPSLEKPLCPRSSESPWPLALGLYGKQFRFNSFVSFDGNHISNFIF